LDSELEGMIGFNKIVIVRPNAEVSIINQNLG
jgi:hypothetical protein